MILNKILKWDIGGNPTEGRGTPFIKHQRRAKASPLGEKLDFRVGYSFPNMRNGGLNAEKEVNKTLLDEFAIQEDVKMVGR